MEEKYSEGNIVWIKLKGYPWWPGIVSMNNKNNTVLFSYRFKNLYLHKNAQLNFLQNYPRVK